MFKQNYIIYSNIKSNSISLFYTSQRKQYLMNTSNTEQLKVNRKICNHLKN